MQSGNAFFFAWCDYGEEFDPLIHARIDDRALSISKRHSEFGRPTFIVRFPPEDKNILEGKQAAHIAIRVNGVIRHLGYGIPVMASGVSQTNEIDVEFDAINPDDIPMQADIIQEVIQNPILYVPQIEEAQDILDAEVALKATTLSIEWDKDGKPYLCSMFGDPTKFKIIDGSRIPAASFRPSFDRVPPRGILGKLTLNWVDYWTGEVDFAPAISDEIDRIGNHYGLAAGEGNFTFTPDGLQSWPKPGETISDSYVVIDSRMSFTDGPGAEPPSESARPAIKINEPNESLAGLPADPLDYGTEQSAAEIASTGFTDPVLKAFGIRSRERTEEIFIYLPFLGQEVVPGNAEPLYLEKSASGLHEDDSVEEHETGREYGVGDRAKVSGVVFQSLINHTATDGLLNDMYDYDPWSATSGEKLWFPVTLNNSPLQYPNTSAAAQSAFGRRCIQHFVRRMVSMLALETRIASNPFDVPVEDAWDLDTGYTVRLTSRFIRGGFLEGKVADLEIFADGNGTAVASVRLASCVGSGNPDEDDYEAPEDDGDGPDGQVPGGEYPVTAEGGPWDIVRYQVPFYIVPPLGNPEQNISCRIDWLGCEQQWALENPGEFVWNPYGKIPGPDGDIPARSTMYVEGAVDADGNPLGSDDWLQQHPTSISVFIDDSRADDAIPLKVFVPITFGWRGPKQMEI